LKKQRGGTAGNVAYSLALLGIKPVLIATLGKDGKRYKNKLKSFGVDTDGVKIVNGDRSASGFVITDKKDNQVWIFYQGAMSSASKLSLNLTGDELVLVGPNDPKAMVKYVDECVKAKSMYMYDPAFAISYLSKSQLKKGIENAAVIIGNDYEKSKLMKLTKMSEKKLLERGKVMITTLGAKGSLIRKGNKTIKIKAARVKNTSDPTGAGDAYRAGFLAGFVNGLPLDVCGRMGAVAAAYTVEKYGTQTHKFTISEFRKRYKDNFGKGTIL